MNVRRVLHRVRRRQLSVPAAVAQLRDLPFAELTFAKVDHHRALRRGFPEVVFGQGKTVGQIVAIARRLLADGQPLIVTKATPAVYARLRSVVAGLRYDAAARILTSRPPRTRRRGTVVIVTAGTSDGPVAAEAEAVARVMGCRVRAVYDVGVAGLHRILPSLPALRRAHVIIVVAGMEGALASVVSGLVSRPVLAVPTSVGYGAAFRGLAPLLTMLNSCSPGVAVVNIDNGFGAGYFASLLCRSA